MTVLEKIYVPSCMKNNFITPSKHMLWVVKRTASLRRFFGAPKTYALTNEKVFFFTSPPAGQRVPSSAARRVRHPPTGASGPAINSPLCGPGSALTLCV